MDVVEALVEICIVSVVCADFPPVMEVLMSLPRKDGRNIFEKWLRGICFRDLENCKSLPWKVSPGFHFATGTSSFWMIMMIESYFMICKTFASCTGKDEGFPTSWVQFLAPWKSGQHGVSGFSVIGLTRSAGEVAKAAQAIVHRAGRLEAESPWRRRACWLQSTSHAPARCLGWGVEGAEDIESADSCLRFMQCWSIAGQSGQNNCQWTLEWKPPELTRLPIWSSWCSSCLWGCVLQRSWAR